MTRLRLCREKDCWNYFQPKTRQIYCGSAKLKTGCAYKNRLRLNAVWNQKHKEVLRRISNSWVAQNREIINAKRRTPEYHQYIKRFKIRKYLNSQLGQVIHANN